MSHIKTLEKTPREIYTGAIGMIAPGRQAQFNVAIRTAWVDNRTGTARYGAGGGIVWDSDPQEEHRELVSKTQILSGVAASEEFELFETMAWSANDGASNLDLHFKRMARSAKYFGMPFDPARATAAMAQAAATCGRASAATRFRLRLSLAGDGAHTAILQPLSSQTDGSQPVAVAPSPVSSQDPSLAHKTNQRQVYKRAREEVTSACGEGVEPLLVNERGEITETDIANIVYELDGQNYTPPTRCGLLPGVLRESLLESGELQERVLLAEDLASIEGLYLINDLRGWRNAQLLGVKTA